MKNWKRIRLSFNMNQQEMADYLGISRQTWIKYEKTDCAPLYIHHSIHWLMHKKDKL